jgi:hypothetical protein
MNPQFFAMLERGRQEQKSKTPRPLHEAQIATLREVFADYRKPPFRAGDLVTPRRGCDMRHEGEPHMVLEMRPDAEPRFMDDSGACTNGVRLDMRVGSLNDGDYVAHWVESWLFEPYPPRP